mgnify:CR=1 FL=1
MFALILASYGMAGAQSKGQGPTVKALFKSAPNLSINEQLPNGSTAIFMAAQVQWMFEVGCGCLYGWTEFALT